MSQERRVAALLQRQPPDLPQEIPDSHTQEEIARWWAARFNFRRAAQALDITEAEAIEMFGRETGWYELQEEIKNLTARAQALCVIEKPGPEQKPEEQPPAELQSQPPQIRMDRRRWNELHRQRRRRGRQRPVNTAGGCRAPTRRSGRTPRRRKP